MNTTIQLVKVEDPEFCYHDQAMVLQYPGTKSKYPEPKIAIIAPSEAQCFKALESVTGLKSEDLGYEAGAHYPLKRGAPYDGGYIMFIYHNLGGITSSLNLLSIMQHVTKKQSAQIFSFVCDLVF